MSISKLVWLYQPLQPEIKFRMEALVTPATLIEKIKELISQVHIQEKQPVVEGRLKRKGKQDFAGAKHKKVSSESEHWSMSKSSTIVQSLHKGVCRSASTSAILPSHPSPINPTNMDMESNPFLSEKRTASQTGKKRLGTRTASMPMITPGAGRERIVLKKKI